jgi:hypothetical protein
MPTSQLVEVHATKRFITEYQEYHPAWLKRRAVYPHLFRATIIIPKMAKTFPFSSLATADLVIDAVYEGGTKGNSADDVLGKLIPGAGNQGGFRQVGGWASPRLVVLYSSAEDPDWPDFIDIYTGVFTFFGDNKRPGRALHDTQRHGNELLRSCFEILHNAPDQRVKIPPFLVFTKGEKGRDVIFRGLAVPGVEGDPADDLVAIWRSKRGERFQNYRAKFTILDTGAVTRQWIEALRIGEPVHACAPSAWLRWIENGLYQPLTAEPATESRTKEQQTPAPGRDKSLIRCIYEYFKDNPHGFEHCAARLAAMMDPNINIDVITRPSVDGGRDAIGTYRVGPIADRIPLDFALEAKCYDPENGVGVKELSRLISRLRHRQFGILVTTSYLGHQAYEELRSDRHPVVVVAGADIAAILVKAGIGTPDAVQEWLLASFPIQSQTV